LRQGLIFALDFVVKYRQKRLAIAFKYDSVFIFQTAGETFMRIISGEDAYASLRRNKAFRWAQHKPDTPPAQSRTRQLAMLPRLSPKFRFDGGESIFTIGSCFARHVESVLEQYGYRFKTRNPENFVNPDECTSPNGFFNKFTTASMLNEIRWALSNESFPEQAYVEADGRWSDGQLPADFASLDRAHEIRARVSSIMSDVGTANYLILTLGLVECWYDEAAGLYLNVAPSAGVIKKYPGRFQVHVLDHKSNLASMEEIYERAKAANPDIRLIVTVSPVPLGATFTGEDIAVANAYSKSTLRAVAGDFTANKPDTDYFPSFEAVTESAPLAAWMDDAIHVRIELVRCVIAHFIKHYGSDAMMDKVDMDGLLTHLRNTLPGLEGV
jgi:hypothetical protein